ncbi:MAG: ABC transporter ATP-binding protein [Actinomycetota bacterium]|nr:ABC transporter ATP-binding protein [Actinomycetota bacterium]
MGNSISNIGTNNSILSVRNLNFSYGDNKVLNNISFNINKGSFTSILGPNGAGKSTLINIISKILGKFEGEIKVTGENITALNSKDIARRIAVVPQSTNPSFGFTVEEMVLMGRYPYISRFKRETKEDFEVIREVMEKTELTQFADRKFNELSGGEKQRVVIAQALAQDSPIMILDEPTSHLDINFQIEFMNLFLKLNRREGKTIIGIFHDINLAIQNSSLIMLLKEGSIFRFGEPEKVINRQNLNSVFHSDVFVGKNPVTQRMYVSPVFDPYYSTQDYQAVKPVKVHIIGGGGAASPILSLLHHHGYRISCGVINTFDTDISTCEMLDVPYIVEAPFSPISIISRNKNLEFIKASDLVILPEIEFGNGNFSNLVSIREALSLNKRVLIMEGKNIEKRDHTGGKAGKLYRKILEEGACVIKTHRQLLDNLKTDKPDNIYRKELNQQRI